MLDFILGKLNLLIFVIAIFSITAFLLFHLGSFFAFSQSNDLMQKLSKETMPLLSRNTSCASKSFVLPNYFSSFVSEKIYYVLKISSIQLEDEEKLVVFSVRQRKNQEQLLSAQSFEFKGKVFFCPAMQNLGNPCSDTETEVVLDPQAAFPTNAFFLIKQVESSEQVLYVVPCNDALCNDIVASHSKKLSTLVGRNGVGFKCIS